MQVLKIHFSADEKSGKEVEVDDATTVLDLRYQLFSLADIPPERILLHFSGVTRRPNDELDATTTLSSAGITSTTKVFCSDSEQPKPPPTNAAQFQASKPPKQTISLSDVKEALQQCGIRSDSRITASSHSPSEKFLAEVRSYYESSVKYEDKDLQEKALAVVPMETLKMLAKERYKTDAKYPTYEHALAKELLHWFKKSFFTWVDSPSCWSCGKKTDLVTVLPPSENEKKYKASRTEQFGCPGCGAETRFPRYRDVTKLLETRRGRCGEWASTFMLIARAAGLRVRAVHDWTDHVWTEIWCGRWVHADSCEDALDEPLLYEKGWKKKLNYCIATGVDCVVDVTQRYTRNFEALRERRTLADEGLLQSGLKRLNDQALGRLGELDRVEAVKRYEQEMVELSRGSGGATETLPRRQSGSANWVQSRGEDGSGK